MNTLSKELLKVARMLKVAIEDESDHLVKMAEYCRKNIDDFEELKDYALTEIDSKRASLQYVAPEFYDRIWDVIEEYCDENGLDPDNFDVEDVFWTE